MAGGTRRSFRGEGHTVQVRRVPDQTPSRPGQTVQEIPLEAAWVLRDVRGAWRKEVRQSVDRLIEPPVGPTLPRQPVVIGVMVLAPQPLSAQLFAVAEDFYFLLPFPLLLRGGRQFRVMRSI